MEIILNIFVHYFLVHFSIYKDTKCVKKHAVLMPDVVKRYILWLQLRSMERLGLGFNTSLYGLLIGFKSLKPLRPSELSR